MPKVIRGLLALPGLVAYHFVRGIKGTRASQFGATAVFDWQSLTGDYDVSSTPQSADARAIASDIEKGKRAAAEPE